MTEYEAYRKNIKSGDIIALQHRGWKTLYDWQVQMVRLFTRSNYSHVGLVWRVSGRLMVIESVTPVVKLTPLSEYAKEGFYIIGLKKSISSAELEFALGQVGKGKYSKWQAVLAFLRKLKIGSDNLWSCAEFLIKCRSLSGVELGQIATPTKVVEKALETGATIQYVKE